MTDLTSTEARDSELDVNSYFFPYFEISMSNVVRPGFNQSLRHCIQKGIGGTSSITSQIAQIGKYGIWSS